MRYTMTMVERHHMALSSFLFQDREVERAALLRCRLSTTQDESRFLVRRIHLFEDESLNFSRPDAISVKSDALMSVLKQANTSHECVVFVHSHPDGTAYFSGQDNITEPPFFRAAFNRIEGSRLHGSIVFSNPVSFMGRVWLPSGEQAPITLVRVIGNRWWFLHTSTSSQDKQDYFDRHIRAFGPNMQHTLSQLHIGVVGAGGTGSAVIEQLIRLGVGKLTVFDNQAFELSNINRVYNSRTIDAGNPKVSIVRRTGEEVGLGTDINPIQARITSESVAKQLRDCDVIFGCTDDNYGRAVLNALALRYIIPVIDMGVRITSQNCQITNVTGRVTILQPGNVCLHCRGRINLYQMRFETMHPEELFRLRGQGYAPELGDPAPAVISFTTGIASSAVAEFINRLTGFTGEEVSPSEVICRFESREIHTISGEARDGCDCQDQNVWGIGDTNLFLNMTWGG